MANKDEDYTKDLVMKALVGRAAGLSEKLLRVLEEIQEEEERLNTPKQDLLHLAILLPPLNDATYEMHKRLKLELRTLVRSYLLDDLKQAA